MSLDPGPRLWRGRGHEVAAGGDTATRNKIKRAMSGAGSPHRGLSRQFGLTSALFVQQYQQRPIRWPRFRASCRRAVRSEQLEAADQHHYAAMHRRRPTRVYRVGSTNTSAMPPTATDCTRFRTETKDHFPRSANQGPWMGWVRKLNRRRGAVLSLDHRPQGRHLGRARNGQQPS